MLNKNYAESIMKVAQGNTGTPAIAPQTDWLNILQQGIDDYYKYDKIRTDRANTQALTDALKGGNEEEIQKAYAVSNPDAYMEYLNKIKLAREMADTEFSNKKELLGLANQYDTALQILKNQGKGGNLSTSAKNYEYLKGQGLSDNDAYYLSFGNVPLEALAQSEMESPNVEEEKKMLLGMTPNLFNMMGKAQDKMKGSISMNHSQDLMGRVSPYSSKLNTKDLTSASKNYEYLKGQGLDDNQAMAIAFGGNTEAVGGALASGSLGAKGTEQLQKDTAKQIAKDKEAMSGVSLGLRNLDDLEKTINENPETVGFQSKAVTGLKRVESLLGGQDAKEFLKNRGYAYRQVGNIKNDLIAKAKQAGQSGINTAREIEQATSGISENSSPEELLGAINAMRKSMNNLNTELANKYQTQATPQTNINSKYQGIVWGK